MVALGVATAITAVFIAPRLRPKPSKDSVAAPLNGHVFDSVAIDLQPDGSNSVITDRPPEIPNPLTADMQPQVHEFIHKAREAVVTDPTSAEAWGNLGAACDAHKLYDCAEPCYRRAHELAPNDFTFVYLLAIVLDSTGRGGAKSVTLYQTAARLNPDYPPILWRLGYTLERQGRRTEARDAYLRSTKLNPNFAIGHRNAGQVLLALGDTDAALRRLKRAAQLAPHDGAVYAALAQAYRRSGDPERAKQAAERSRDLEPVYDVPDPVRNAVRAKAIDSVTLYTRAKSLVNTGRYAEAIPDLKMCEAADPDDPILQIFLATCYRATDQLELAKAHAMKALQLKKDTLSAHLELAAVSIKQGELDKGLRHYRRAQEMEPTSGKVHSWIANVLVKQGYNDDGIAAFERAAELGSVSAQAHWIWGVALSEKGDAGGAMEHYREAIRLNPGFAHAYYALGLVLERDGRRDEAIENYRRAAKINSNHPAAQRLAALEAAEP